MTIVSRVTPPDAMNYEWVGEASEECKKRYETYYKGRKLKADSEAWSTTAVKFVTRNAFSLAQAAGALTMSWLPGFAVAVSAKNEVPYRVTEKAVEVIHANHTKRNRMPIEHERINKVVNTLYEIKECENAEEFITKLQEAYTTVFFGSKSSSDLKTALCSKAAIGDKVDQIVGYLLAPAGKGFPNVFENNGKKFYQAIICTTEKSIITKGEKK